MGLVLGLLGIALGLAPIGLPAVGYEISPTQGYGILVSAALFLIAAVVVFLWPWVGSMWSWLRRDAELREARDAQETLGKRLGQLGEDLEALRAENEELMASAEVYDKHQETVDAYVEEYATGVEKYPRPRSLPPDAGSRNILEDLSFRLTDLVRGELVRGKTFNRCTIHGPAIVYPMRGLTTGSTFVYAGNPETILWEVQPGPAKAGIILVEDCVFNECVFVRIGFVGTEVDLRPMRAQMYENLPPDQRPTKM